MFHTKVVEKLKKNMCSVTFFRKSYVYELIWKNMVKPVRARMTI